MSIVDDKLEHGLPTDVDVIKLLDAAKKEFYKDPSVIGVGIGSRRKDGETREDETTIIVYVREKILDADVKSKYRIPPLFQGIRTDVVAPFGPDTPLEALGFEEGHQHSNDMGFIDWPRLHELRLDTIGELGWHGKIQDFGDVCVIEDDGTLVQNINGTDVVDFVRAYKLFRTTHPDIYDFVTFFTDTAHGMPPQGGSSWYSFVFNDTEGIGFGPYDQRGAYGSSRLQGIMFLNQGHFPFWRYVMLQEQGHRWASFARYRNSATDPDMTDHLLGGWGHWVLNFDDDRSPMDYDSTDWRASNGNFLKTTLDSEERTYCNLDLYLMGLLGPLEVGDFSLLSNVQLVSGNEYTADKKRLTTQNIIWAEGARAPSVATSQKQFKTCFVVLTGEMDEVHDLVEQVDRLRLRFEEDFFEATKTLGRVDTTLGPMRFPSATDFRTATVTVPSGKGRRSIEHTVSFGSRVRRAGVALNGFKLDFVSSDHHINVVEADTDIVSISGNKVTFRVQCDYRDKNADDKYKGYVTALVTAEVDQ